MQVETPEKEEIEIDNPDVVPTETRMTLDVKTDDKKNVNKKDEE